MIKIWKKLTQTLQSKPKASILPPQANLSEEFLESNAFVQKLFCEQ